MPSSPVEQARFNELNDMRFVMDDPRGRAVIARLIAMSRCRDSCPTVDYGTLAYWEGARLVGLELLRDLTEAAPEKMPIMDKEHKMRLKRLCKQPLAKGN